MINIIDLKFIQEKIKNYKDGLTGTSLGVEMEGKSKDWEEGYIDGFNKIEELIKEYLEEAEKETLALIEKLIPDSYWMLRNFAKTMPESFYIDDRVKIKDEDQIYQAVKRLADIRKQL